MIGNLLDNAIRHAATNGSVMASLARSADRVSLRITNDGPSIAVADRERIFRTIRSNRLIGRGRSRAADRAVDRRSARGTLRLEESEPGSTTFVVTLPSDSVIDRSSGH